MTRILIIEDEKSLRAGLRDILGLEGFTVLEAENGRTGIQLATQHLPDLILCDIMMPEMNGYEVLTELGINPSTRLIPFVFMTALADRADIRHGMDLGADDYLVKPFTREELLKAVEVRIRKTETIREDSDSALNTLRGNIIQALPHELNTPLIGIIGFAEMLRDQPGSFSTDELREVGNTIYDSGQRLLHLIRNYFTYARLELKQPQELTGIELKNPGKTCMIAAEAVAKSYQRTGDLVLQTADLPIRIHEADFEKMVTELVDNAFKFSQPGTPVRVYCGKQHDMFCFSVEDQGIGFSSAEASRIGAYMQFDRKIYEQQGSGLGLIISKRIAGLFHGKMEIESKPGVGSKFTILLHLA